MRKCIYRMIMGLMKTAKKLFVEWMSNCHHFDTIAPG